MMLGGSLLSLLTFAAPVSAQLAGDSVAVAGVVERIAIGATQQVEAGDLLVVVRPAH